jgi:hypothetical protein
LLLDMIIEDGMTMHAVAKSRNIKRIARMVNDETELGTPSPQTLTRRVHQSYEEYRSLIHEMLSKTDCPLSVTFDGWSSSKSQMRGFIGVPIHFIHPVTGAMATLPIAFRRIRGTHDAENIAIALITALDDFEISSRLFSVTCDNHSVNDAVVKHLEDWAIENDSPFRASSGHIRCLPHIINLAAKQALLPLAQHLRKIRKVAVLCRRSTKISDEVQAVSKKQLCNANGLRFMKDCKTRWNSTHAMLQRAIKLRKV